MPINAILLKNPRDLFAIRYRSFRSRNVALPARTGHMLVRQHRSANHHRQPRARNQTAMARWLPSFSFRSVALVGQNTGSLYFSVHPTNSSRLFQFETVGNCRPALELGSKPPVNRGLLRSARFSGAFLFVRTASILKRMKALHLLLLISVLPLIAFADGWRFTIPGQLLDDEGSSASPGS